ncbi:MAG: hypothetical protein KGI60_03405 [Patescibacteria group bacterium]|nr:hypothetical protein [Patescibacteria group bacterium]
MGFENPKRVEKKMAYEKRIEKELAVLEAKLAHLEAKPHTEFNKVKIFETKADIEEQKAKIQQFQESQGRVRGGDFLRDF